MQRVESDDELGNAQLHKDLTGRTETAKVVLISIYATTRILLSK